MEVSHDVIELMMLDTLVGETAGGAGTFALLLPQAAAPPTAPIVISAAVPAVAAR